MQKNYIATSEIAFIAVPIGDNGTRLILHQLWCAPDGSTEWRRVPVVLMPTFVRLPLQAT